MKKLTFILLLLLSCLNVWASTVYTYPASSDESNIELKLEFNGNIATVTLYQSGAFDTHRYLPSAFFLLSEWEDVKYIKFVSKNNVEYNTADWASILNFLGQDYFEAGELSLDFSSMKIDDANFVISYGGSKINYIKMPNDLKELAEGAFNRCTFLSAIGWSPKILKIGDGAFFETAFTSITVPEGVTSIGLQAFSFCKELTTIYLPTSLETVGANVLEGCDKLEAIHSHRRKAPEAQGDICDNTGWSFPEDDFAFYEGCILYIQPNKDTFDSYCTSPYWRKFFTDGAAKICLHTYDLNRPLVKGVQKLQVVQPNVQPEENIPDGLTVVEVEGLDDRFYRTFPINTVYQRDMKEIKWYTIMLPFDVDETTVTNVFGGGTQIMGYSGIHDNTLCFQEAKTSITANVPYLIKPGEGKSEYEFDGEKISYSEYPKYPEDAEHPELLAKPTEIGEPGAEPSYNQYASEFVGTYCNQQIPVDAYYLKNDLFYYMPSENTQKGWKAYSGVVIINSGATADGSVAARPSATYLDINLDADMPTGIDSPTSVAIGSQPQDGPIYTLSGQQVKNPGKGIYIRNGKKFIIK